MNVYVWCLRALDAATFAPPIDGMKKENMLPVISGLPSRYGFSQKISGAWGGDIATVARSLSHHGCNACGSVPLDFPDTNDVNNGELTFNFVGLDAVGGYNGLC